MRRKRLSALAQLRTAFADQNYPRLRAALARVLSAHVAAAAKGVRATGKLSLTADTRKAWARELAKVQRPLIIHMVAHGWELAGSEVSAVQAVQKKSAGLSLAQQLTRIRGNAETVGVGEWQDFVVRADWPAIDRWLVTTAESASATTAVRLKNIVDRASQLYETPESGAGKRGLTPTEISAELLREGLAQTEARAQMLAHTGAIWAYGEGAIQRYDAEGVAVVEWLTADDDLRCPACAEMNGKRVETAEPFFRAGDNISATLGIDGALKVPSGSRGFDIRHPPLHPNCRCTVLPIVDETQLDGMPDLPP